MMGITVLLNSTHRIADAGDHAIALHGPDRAGQGVSAERVE
jgi:hypothetical protein